MVLNRKHDGFLDCKTPEVVFHWAATTGESCRLKIMTTGRQLAAFQLQFQLIFVVYDQATSEPFCATNC